MYDVGSVEAVQSKTDKLKKKKIMCQISGFREEEKGFGDLRITVTSENIYICKSVV